MCLSDSMAVKIIPLFQKPVTGVWRDLRDIRWVWFSRTSIDKHQSRNKWCYSMRSIFYARKSSKWLLIWKQVVTFFLHSFHHVLIKMWNSSLLFRFSEISFFLLSVKAYPCIYRLSSIPLKIRTTYLYSLQNILWKTGFAKMLSWRIFDWIKLHPMIVRSLWFIPKSFQHQSEQLRPSWFNSSMSTSPRLMNDVVRRSDDNMTGYLEVHQE